ncbi:hypothetical protein B0A49_06070 [Cryomyces minteri]|uniref:Uncharacterized protein n=1 Tax=Cryomyces minteri TaxID=331657 RepID=A0A4U0XAN2_9PEZI|nr:hypothetical protein B0A49_06070 [Cryomyces minteri]
MQPALSATNIAIVVTGTGSAIGRATALAYAAAGAARLALLGRTVAELEASMRVMEAEFPAASATCHVADVADEEALKRVAKQDVLVPNAGITIAPEPTAQTSVAERWRVFEVSHPSLSPTAARRARPADCSRRRTSRAARPPRTPFSPPTTPARIVAVSAGSIGFPAASRFCGDQPAYNASKIAQVRSREHLAAENAHLLVALVHPGVVATEMFDDDGAWINECLAGGKVVSLPARFMVQVTSPEARFLKCSWDVDELKARAREIMETRMLTANILGWPFQPK